MASWGSPGRLAGDVTPMTPPTPLSPSALPRWLMPTHSRKNLLPNGKLKLMLVAGLCLFLGWMVTSTLGPGSYVEYYNTGQYDVASTGVLTDPSGFGTQTEKEDRLGFLGGNNLDEGSSEQNERPPKRPSVSGALADLHHAVSSKFSSWGSHKESSSHAEVATFPVNEGDISPHQNTTWETIHDGIKEDDLLGAPIRIGKCTMLTGNPNGMYERAIRTHEAHDREHGYRLHVLRQDLQDGVWSKTAYILSLLLRELSKPKSERLDWLFWTDADTIIMNPYVPIEVFLPPAGTEFDDVHLMYANDWNGLNAGVFLVRVNQWAIYFFSAAVSYRFFKPNEQLGFAEQTAMSNLMKEQGFAEHVLQAPQRWFNAYQGEHNQTLEPFSARRGDLLVHFAGVVPKGERMEFWLNRAEQHLDDWEIPFKSTTYPQEARDFWADQRDIRRDRKAKLQETKDNAGKMLTTTDQRLRDYGDRLNEDEKHKITEKKDALKHVLEDDKTKNDRQKIEEAMKSLSEALSSLTNTITEANKVLLSSAHEAIFGGEKELMEAGFNKGTTNAELEKIVTDIKSLKALIMAPEESWSRHGITDATNSLTEARAKWQGKLAETKALEAARPNGDTEQTTSQDTSSTETTSSEGNARTPPP